MTERGNDAAAVVGFGGIAYPVHLVFVDEIIGSSLVVPAGAMGAAVEPGVDEITFHRFISGNSVS